MSNKLSYNVLCVVFLLLATLPRASAQYRDDLGYAFLGDSETVSALRKHIVYISSSDKEGRAPGSEGELATARYMAEMFEYYGLDLLAGKDGDVFGINRDVDTLVSRNIAAFVPGYDRNLRDRYIVIGARMDNLGADEMTVNGEKQSRIYYGANGNASGLAVLLELANKLKTNELLLRRSVILVGFGSSSVSNAGAWYFLNRSFPEVDKIDAMINLDMLGTGNPGFYAYTSSNADLNALLSSMGQGLQPLLPEVTAEEPYPSDHRAFYDKGIPSVFFTSGRYPEHNTPSDTQSIIQYGAMEPFLEYLFNFTVALAGAPAPVFNPADELKKKRSDDDKVFPYYECDWAPTFLGSSDPRMFLDKWVYHYLKYPAAAVEEGIQGRVLVSFVIDVNGKVKDVKVVRGVHPLLDEEAVRVVSASPDWKPGKISGKKVKSEMSLYIEFRLEQKGRSGKGKR